MKKKHQVLPPRYDKDKDGPLDRFIKISEASKLLGYAHYNSVIKLIERGKLQAYKLPQVTRKRVLLSEVENLIELKNDRQNKYFSIPKKAGRHSNY
ncbi:MAG: hypothetical protein CMI23_11785 [Opitutae bacterium]|nr:hypothetical protein [Opitutae bacterium]